MSRRDWSDPYMLEPRPNHCATEAEQEDFEELLQELGLVASHIGATMDVHVQYRLPPKRRTKRKK